MNCEELTQLLPDLVDGTLPETIRGEAEAALAQCPDCRRELEAARQIRTLLMALQAENADLRVPAGFETRLLARVHNQHSGLELLDLSSRAFVMWLIDLLNLLGGLFDPNAASRANRPHLAGA
jgi:hypothetical protein